MVDGKKARKVEPLINQSAWKSNVSTLSFLRNYTAVIVGIAVGIFGISGWFGFLFHYASQLLCAPAMMLKGCTSPKAYFHSWSMLLFQDTLSSTPLLSYILFWMVFYNLCHVF